jgi:TetR/AcrR family transcriptional regulator
MTDPHPRGVGRPKEPIPREHLLDAAREAFAAAGFAGASMRDVAERAGVRKTSLFYHFGSKEGLYREVLDGAVSELLGYIGGALQESGGFEERIDRLGSLVVEYLGTHPGAARLLVREMVDLGPYAAGPGRAAIEATLDSTASFLDAGMAAGAFQRRDPRQLALSIVGLHLFYFSAEEVSSGSDRTSIFAPDVIEARKNAVVDQVRALVLATQRGRGE